MNITYFQHKIVNAHFIHVFYHIAKKIYNQINASLSNHSRRKLPPSTNKNKERDALKRPNTLFQPINITTTDKNNMHQTRMQRYFGEPNSRSPSRMRLQNNGGAHE